MANDTWITPGRHTRLILDVQGPVALRPAWQERRAGAQIQKTRTSAAASEDVQFQPGGGWTLKPLHEDLSRTLDQGSGGFGGAIQSTVRQTDVNLGPHWGEVPTFRKATDLPGLGASADLVDTGGYAFYKRVPAGQNWSSHLTGDAAAFPQPTLPSALIPMDRVLSGKLTYPPNTGFVVAGRLPPGAAELDNLFTFYFGGPNETTPALSGPGQFAVTLRGNGRCILWEKQGEAWVERHEWNVPTPHGNFAHFVLRIFPYGRDTIALSGAMIDGLVWRGPFFGQNMPGYGDVQRFDTFYRNHGAISGYRTKKAITGPGPIRLDVRRDLRAFFQLHRLRPPAAGTLVDLPFWCPYPIPADTHIRVRGETFRPEGTTLTVELFDADTDTPLTPAGTGVFESITGQQAYYARFTFTADSAREQTPVLWAYQVEIPGAQTALAPISLTGGAIRSVSITGPDLDPQAETANLQVEDPENQLSLLRARGRIPARVAVLNDAAAVTTILMDGEVSQAVGTWRGKPGRVYPSSWWHRYDVTLVGLWARLADQINLDLVPFLDDPNAGEDESGNPLPWKVTDAIRYLLGPERLGWPLSQLDIPDIDIRFFSSEGRFEDYLLQPTVSAGEFIKSLCEKYLAMTLLWDPNAGAQGMWRLLPQNVTGTNVLAVFHGGGGAAPGVMPVHPNSYGPGETFYLHESFREEIRPPEANFIMVLGFENILPPTKMASTMYNPKSFDFTGPTADPLHLDYLGFFKPLLHVDTTLKSKNATAFVCRRLYNFVAHGFRWFKFRTPLLLVTDPLDPYQARVRPLRIQDAVTVWRNGVSYNCIVRSVNPNYERDGLQLQDCEVVVVS